MTKINTTLNRKDLTANERDYLAAGYYPVGTCSCCSGNLYNWYSNKCEKCRTEEK